MPLVMRLLRSTIVLSVLKLAAPKVWAAIKRRYELRRNKAG